MGIFDSLFGSKKESYGESGAKGTATQTNVEDMQSVFDRITESLGSLRSSGGVSRGSEVVRAQLENAIKQLPKAINRYSREQAIEDSSGAVQAVISDIINSDLGGILRLQTMSGGTKDSPTRIASENLTAKAAAEGAKVRLGAIQDYAQLQLGGMNALNQLLTLGGDFDVRSEEEQISEDKASEEGKETSTATKNATQTSAQSGYDKGTERGRDGILTELKSLFPSD